MTHSFKNFHFTLPLVVEMSFDFNIELQQPKYTKRLK